MTRPEQVDLLIVGGGMVGLTLAAALVDRGMRVVVLERSEPAPPRRSLGIDLRVSAIVCGNVAILRGIGGWPDAAEPIRRMEVWDDQGSGAIRFDAAELGAEGSGFLGCMVENSALCDALRDRILRGEGVELVAPDEVAEVRWRRDGVEVLSAAGLCWRTPLLVAADGARSALRARAGIGVWRHDFRQQGIVATIRPEHHHRQVAWQRFLPTGPLALLPMADGLCSIVWSAHQARAEALMALDDAAFLRELQLAFGPQLGRIDQVGARAAFPLCSQLARHMVRPRLALIGDAAHAIHPLAGLGVNLGIRDAMVLADEILTARRFGEDYGAMALLAGWRRRRLPDVLATMAAMEGLHHLFTSRIAPLAALRGAGMRLVDNAGLIKRMLMRHATGLALPVPRRL
ncbi:MAG: FAD-dependent oxidoreductase [Zetaproteobacteria bacterium]|nr:MAG: FAD-dependent oxidoreductase [Zetaproteobacteria bacterium]